MSVFRLTVSFIFTHVAVDLPCPPAPWRALGSIVGRRAGRSPPVKRPLRGASPRMLP